MRITESQLRRIVRQEILREAQHTQRTNPSAGPDWGDVLFSGKRNDGVPTDEPDTSSEFDFWWDLKEYVSDENLGRLAPSVVQKIRDALSSGNYSKLVKAPPYGTLYRGTNADEAFVSRVTGLSGDDLPRAGAMDVDFVLNPRGKQGGITSWSSSRRAATGFSGPALDKQGDPAHAAPGKGFWPVLLWAAPVDNPNLFLDLAPIMTYTNNFLWSARRDEREILGLGPIRVTQIEWNCLKTGALDRPQPDITAKKPSPKKSKKKSAG
jgi:hypothetical protein